MIAATRVRRTRGLRRAFNLIELLIALSITSALLTATMVALDASFSAYQSTTEEASTHTIGRLIMHRCLTLIRSGTEFGPFPTTPTSTVIESDFIEFLTPDGQVLVIEWDSTNERLVMESDGTTYTLLDGVVAAVDPDTGEDIPPFTLEYQDGRQLYRATVDLSIIPDDNMSVEIEDGSTNVIRLVGTAMPRNFALQ